MAILHAPVAFQRELRQRILTSFAHVITGTPILTSSGPASALYMYLMQFFQKANPFPRYRIEDPQGLKETAEKQFRPQKPDHFLSRYGAAGFAATSVPGMKHPLYVRFVKRKKTALKDLCEKKGSQDYPNSRRKDFFVLFPCMQ